MTYCFQVPQKVSSWLTVLECLEKAGLRARKKMLIFVSSVTYLGHKNDGEGLYPLPDKVKAIQEAPPPTNT